MGVLEMKLIFNNPDKKYYNGETISGRLVVHSRESVTLRSITIKFQGKAKTHWSEGEDSYFATQKFFKNYITLYGGTGKTEQLPAGEHCYTFQLLLPVNVPSTFKGRDGYTRYKVKANIDRPQWPDSCVLEEINVISHVDLNSSPEYQYPLSQETNKYFCCCCCKSGPLTLVSKINARAFVPGDVISLMVEIDNASNVGINTVSYELKRAVVYYTKKRKNSTKENKVLLKEMLGESVLPHNSKAWTCQVRVPQLSPPSFLKKCDIIDLGYRLKVRARPVGGHLDLVNDLPIVIGTIPFRAETVFS